MYNDYMGNLYSGGGSGIVQGIIPYGPGWGPGYYMRNVIQSINQHNQTELENIKSSKIKEINSNESISNYMNKEFLYESELKDIENKFHFKFEDLIYTNINPNNKIYKASMQIIEEIKDDLNQKYISKIKVIEFSFMLNSIYVTFNNSSFYTINIESNDITDNNKDSVMNMCNKIITQNNPDYQKFYEKYKNRIVKDNEYEDLSFYEKILKENT